MNHYTYESVTGPITIEINEQWYSFLTNADTADSNAERRHTRPDHKYAPGTPISINELETAGIDIVDQQNGFLDVELDIDLDKALTTLTVLQRRYFVLAHLHGYSNAEIGRIYGRDRSTIREALKTVNAKLKNNFSYHPPI